MNIKFPKESIVFLDEIKQAIKNRNYKKLISEYNNIILNAPFLKQYDQETLNIYIKIIFELREFEKYITLVEELRKQEIEDPSWYFYMFSILLYKKDIYYAKSVINRSKILNDSSISYLINEDEGDYIKIIHLHSTLLETIGPCLIMINFINELLIESFQAKINDEYIIMRYFDLINLLFEYGMSEDFISLFTSTLETIYQIDIV